MTMAAMSSNAVNVNTETECKIAVNTETEPDVALFTQTESEIALNTEKKYRRKRTIKRRGKSKSRGNSSKYTKFQN